MNFIQTFQSKRNSVTLFQTVQGLIVKKRFADPIDAAKEASVYGVLDGKPLKTAKLIAQRGDSLFFSYLSGITFVDLLERQEQSGLLFSPWEKLLDWLFDFYHLTGLVMADLNLRNFLYDDTLDEVAGLDFEESKIGAFEDMIARLCAYILLYDPAFTPLKEKIIQHILNCCDSKKYCTTVLMEGKIDRETQTIQDRREGKWTRES